MPHGHERIGNGNSFLASQVIVATSGKTEGIVVCRPRLTAGWYLDGGDDLDALEHCRDQRGRDPIVAEAMWVTVRSRAATSLLRWPLAVERETWAQ